MRLQTQRREARGNGLKRGSYAGDSGLAWNARVGWNLFVGERLFVAPEIGGRIARLCPGDRQPGVSSSVKPAA
jgi:hypothetical protein